MNIKEICCSPIEDSSSFSRLKTVKVKMCSQLKSIFFFYIVKFLTSLETIDVSECDSLQAVVSEEEEGSNKVVLHKLCSLALQKLPSFVSFYKTDDREIVSAEDDQSATTSISLFNEKVPIFPELEKIQLSNMEMLQEIWPREDEVSVDSFPSLISIDINRCNKLEILFPNHTKCWYLHLKSLKVHYCQWVEFIFEITGSSKQNDTKSALSELNLYDLSYLKQVWNVDPKRVLNFTNLQNIKISYCNTMSNVLPASIAKDLGKLESFSIHSCRNLEEIIGCDGGSETSSEVFKFPELVSMSFSGLTSIRCFYKGSHIVECPKLKKLTMKECPNLEIFKIESAKEEVRALLSAEKVTSKLEHLEIDSKGAKWLMSNTGKYRMNSLKQLHLNHSWLRDDESLYSFLHTIPNLQILELSSSWIRELVPSGKTAPKLRLGSVLLLKEFTLSYSYMEDIGFERDPALQRSLHRLVLHSCYKLTRLAHSSVSFTHLTYLQVFSCHELKTLMTCSTAKSLVQLTTIKVSYCGKLNEIVSNDEGNDDDKEIKIVFPKLITIVFEGLISLTSFCSDGNCEFSMPLLEKLILKECPKMKTFTAKLITTPKLPSVLVSERYGEEEKGYWEGDLNRTMQMVFADKVLLALSFKCSFLIALFLLCS
ncbi:hypothetical protein PIB30_096180 [Stylosanthes scabra]|uniref:Disease resistance protein At4g27190-like leucine-rich repeats domain-containing protein n=1 Tax=Stylosanthes scabra TaxID=79078 RepID=A0ABU6YXU2_9FABA|nr:hypothetical protein [Stylosanthes scabra]